MLKLKCAVRVHALSPHEKGKGGRSASLCPVHSKTLDESVKLLSRKRSKRYVGANCFKERHIDRNNVIVIVASSKSYIMASRAYTTVYMIRCKML